MSAVCKGGQTALGWLMGREKRGTSFPKEIPSLLPWAAAGEPSFDLKSPLTGMPTYLLPLFGVLVNPVVGRL